MIAAEVDKHWLDRGVPRQGCSNCVFGSIEIFRLEGGRISSDGREIVWEVVGTSPAGIRRSCFGWWERIFSKPPVVVRPGGDDTCINPGRFRTKS